MRQRTVKFHAIPAEARIPRDHPIRIALPLQGNRIWSLFTMSINTQPPRPRSSSPRLKRKRNFRRDVGDISAFARGSSAITPTDDPSAGDHATRPKPFSSKEDGGARRDRTDDLMLAKHALSQLSYGPSFGERKMRAIRRGARRACGLRPVASSARGDARHDARHQARRPSGLRPSAGRFLSKRRCAP